MKLYVMRHGPAEEQAASYIDGDRVLTPAGREGVRRVAIALLQAGEAPQQVLTSPLVRAVQTAEIVAVTTNLGDRGGTVSARRELAPAGQLVGLVHRLVAEGQKRVLLVGHEPDLSDLVEELAGPLSQPFEKAMVVGVHIPAEGGAARRRFVLDPNGLRLNVDGHNRL